MTRGKRQLAQIGGLTEKVASWNPVKDAPGHEFAYIDLSAVDNEAKTVTGIQTVHGRDAPSRARQLVRSGDILVSTVRPNLNGVAQVPEALDGATASTGFCVLRVKPEKLDSSYLFHWVRSSEFVADMVRKATGASYPAVSDKIICQSEIPLPPLEEQKRIATILDQADELHHKRKRALDRLNKLGQAIFIEVFGEPKVNPFDLPQCVLGDVVHSASDGPHVSPTYSDSGIPFLSTRHVKAGEILWHDLKFLTIEDAEAQWKKCRPQLGDLLYTKGGTTGIAAVVDTEDPFAVWVHVALLKTNRAKVEPLWLETMLNCDFCYQQSQTLTHGIANRDLGLKRMVNIKMYLPPLDAQRKFVERLQAVRTMRSNMRLAEEAGQSLFASLQHRAYQGAL